MNRPGPTRHGVILAGGAGSRMGSQKPSVELDGRPLIDFPIAAMREAGLEVSVVAKRDSELPVGEGTRVIRESDAPLHALLGIVTALELLEAPVVVCACDMPFVTGELLAWIANIDEAPVAAPRLGDIVDPLLGRYTLGALPALKAAASTGDSARAAVESAGLRVITEAELAQFGRPERLLFDVDTPQDLALATQMIGRDLPGP